MLADENTRLLAEPVAACTEDGDNPSTETKSTTQNFALWQMGVFCGIVLAFADTSLVWATHETVASHFNSLQNSSWMMTSFTIGYCVTLPLYGRLSDNYGRLRPLIAAFCTFCLGCILCGVGQAYWLVILGRLFTGCGASGIVSLANLIITDIAAPSQIAVLRSYINVATVIGLSLGGPLGGFLGATVGWRWSYLGQVPLAVICCLCITRGLRASKVVLEEEGRQQHQSSGIEPKPRRLMFDYPGAITLAIWISSLLAVINLLNQYPLGHPLVLSLTIVGAVTFLVFLALELFPGKRELLLPIRLFKTQIGAFCLAQLLIVGSCHGLISQIAPYFANTQGFSDSAGGAETIPSSLATAVGAFTSGRLIRRYGRYKRLSLGSLVACIAASLLILFQWSSHPVASWEAALTTIPIGLFGGIVLSTQFIGLYLNTPKERMATAISMYYMCQQIGIAFGISLSSSLLRSQFQRLLQQNMKDIPDNANIIRGILTDSALIRLLPAEIKNIVQSSYLKSFWTVPAVAASAQALALIPMLFFTTERYLE